jgi:septal ring factor EnvC (AmiA/AmiB activator)
MALSDFAEKIGKVITTTVTLSEDVKRAEASIKDFQQQLRESAKALDLYNSKIESLNDVKAAYENIRDKAASLEAEVRQLKALRDAEYKAHAQELEIMRLTFEAQMDERFRKLEASFSAYASNLINAITSISRNAGGMGITAEILHSFDLNARQLPPQSED